MEKDKLIKPLLLIFAIIIFCSILIRLFAGSETLAEYAARNPETSHTEGRDKPENLQTDLPASPEHSRPQENSPSAGLPQEGASSADSAQENTPSAGLPQGSGLTSPETLDSEQGQGAENNLEQTDTAEDSAIPSGSPEDNGQKSEDLEMNDNPERIVYKEGFYYEPLSEDLKKRITGISYPITEADKDSAVTEASNIVDSAADIKIPYDDLCYMSVLHYNFHGVERTGELICNKAIAPDLIEIFYELYRNEYQIEQIRLIDEYGGDDTLSMQDNNTSCFNYRVVDGTSNLSKHALGLAIDINPFFNPYVVFRGDGSAYISPQGSETYADRSGEFAYKIDENDLCYKLFKEHGFIWGGNWNSCKDYQHFQKVPE